MYQTRPPDETLAYLSDVPTADLLDLVEDFPHVRFRPVPNRDDWGHEKRAMGLEHATGDVIGWFNDDDDYTLNYIEQMLKPLENGDDIAYCWWRQQNIPYRCDFRLGSSTAGNFVVRTRVARSVGWNGRRYEADGDFIDALAAVTPRVTLVPEFLYTHNEHG